MKLLLLLPSLMVLGRVFAEDPPTTGTYMEVCGVDYSEADSHAKTFEREAVKKRNISIATLGQELSSPFSNPILKARAIYSWLHHYVAFDAVHNSTRRSPEEVIIRGIGTGLDYAKLLEELALGAGLEVMYILGHGKGPKYKEPPVGSLPPFQSTHAWNAVKLKHGWQLIDPSYGSLVVKTQDLKYTRAFDAGPFSSSPETFRRTHFPEKPEHQFCSDEISWKDYMFMPDPPKIYPRFKKLGLDKNDVTPNRFFLPAGVATRFVVKVMCDQPPIKREDQYLLAIDDGGIVTALTMEVEGRVWSALIPSLDIGMLKFYVVERVDGGSAKGLTPEQYEKGRKSRRKFENTMIGHWQVVGGQELETEMPMEDPYLKCTFKTTVASDYSNCKEKPPNATFHWNGERNMCLDKKCEAEVDQSWQTSGNDSQVLDASCFDYKEADAHGAKFPPETVKSVRSLAKDLTSPFTSHALKARAIYAWQANHIAYDHASAAGENAFKSAEKLIRAGMATCQGYAELFRRLGIEAGLDVIFIAGAVKVAGRYTPPKNGVIQQPYKTYHAWNAVKLNGRWQLIDATFGAKKSFRANKMSYRPYDPRYFTGSPEFFRRSHFPRHPEQQFCSDVITWEDFNFLPDRLPIYEKGNELRLDLEEIMPKDKRIQAGKPTRFEVRCRCGPIKPEDQYLLFIVANNGDSFPLTVGEDGCLWSAVVTPLSDDEPVSLFYLDRFGKRSGKGVTQKEKDAPPPGTFRSEKVITEWKVYR